MDMYCGLPVDFSSFNLPRNGDFTQVSFVSVDALLIYREMGAFTKEVMWQPVWLTDLQNKCSLYLRFPFVCLMSQQRKKNQ